MSEDRITVVFFHIGTETFGGGSRMLLRLFKRIDRDCFEPILLTNHQERLYEESQDIGIETRVIPFRGSLGARRGRILDYPPHKKFSVGLRLLQFNVEAWSVLRRADILWGLNIRAVLTLAPFQAISNTPLLWNIGLGFESQGTMHYLNEAALRRSDHVFIESDTQAKRLFTPKQYERYKEQFTVFRKGIDVEKFNPERHEALEEINGINIERPNVGTAALLNSRKGHDYFIRAAAQVLENHPEITIYIAGEVPQDEDVSYRQRLESLCAELEIENQVEFLGWVEFMPSYLASLDVFVMPSLNEGIPGAVREALSMETPTVATDVGGTRDVVRDEETGILVKPEDPDALAEGIDLLLRDDEFAESVATAGRSLMVDEFSVDGYINRYEEFLKTIYFESGG